MNSRHFRTSSTPAFRRVTPEMYLSGTRSSAWSLVRRWWTEVRRQWNRPPSRSHGRGFRVSNVGGPRHGSTPRPGLPGAGWQCPICGTLNISETCTVCAGNPNWRRPDPVPAQNGRQAAQAALQRVPAEPEPEPGELHDFRVQASVSPTEAHLRLSTDAGEFTGHGATMAEAMADAIGQWEDEVNRPKCPTCGQAWPHDREFPSPE